MEIYLNILVKNYMTIYSMIENYNYKIKNMVRRRVIRRTYRRKGFRRYKRKMFAKRVKRIVNNMAELKYFRSDILNYTRPLN